MFDDFKVANYPKSLVSPELYARPLAKLFSGDVIDGFTVSPGTGLKVVIAPGNALIRYGSSAVASARIVSLVSNFELSIDTADVSNPRIDLVVLYIDNDVDLPDEEPSVANLDGPGVAKAKIIKGTAAATPSAPNATAIQSSVGAGNPYTVLAEVRVNAGVSVIAEERIADVRRMAVLPGAKLDMTSLPRWKTNKTTNTVTPIPAAYAYVDTGVRLTVPMVEGGEYEIVAVSPFLNSPQGEASFRINISTESSPDPRNGFTKVGSTLSGAFVFRDFTSPVTADVTVDIQVTHNAAGNVTTYSPNLYIKRVG